VIRGRHVTDPEAGGTLASEGGVKEADMPSWVRWASVPAVAIVVTAGIWITGALLTNDFALARVLTGGFLTTAGALALAVAWRWRALALPVLATFTVVAGGLSGWLLVGSTRDVRVEERLVAIATSDLPQTDGTDQTDQTDRTDPDAAAPAVEPSGKAVEPSEPVARSSGKFVSVAHDTSGTATLIRKPDGSLAVRLTDLATDPGPDLRVYAVPGTGRSARAPTDLGRLRGNVGTQQYAVPAKLSADNIGAVVIWCRAFGVNFGYATLRAT
jgi:hypothetical protein